MNRPRVGIYILALTGVVVSLACVRSVGSVPAILPTTELIRETQPSAASTASPTPTGSVQPTSTAGSQPSAQPAGVGEVPVSLILLAGPAASSDAEITGMAWWRDTLFLLPRFPDKFGKDQKGGVFTLPKTEILAFLDGTRASPLEPQLLPFDDPGIEQLVPGFEGYQAIAFDGNIAYLTLAASPADKPGYLVKANLAPDLSSLTLDRSRLAELLAQTTIPGMSYESVLVFGQRVVALYAANGTSVNPQPLAPMLGIDLTPVDQLAFPQLPYRVTDATPPDIFGSFWVINTFNPLDTSLKASADPLAEQYGKGPTHSLSQSVERLVQLQFSESGIVLAETPPIQLVLIEHDSTRNWKAIAPLAGRGFLLAADQYPATILGFVAYNP